MSRSKRGDKSQPKNAWFIAAGMSIKMGDEVHFNRRIDGGSTKQETVGKLVSRLSNGKKGTVDKLETYKPLTASRVCELKAEAVRFYEKHGFEPDLEKLITEEHLNNIDFEDMVFS